MSDLEVVQNPDTGVVEVTRPAPTVVVVEESPPGTLNVVVSGPQGIQGPAGDRGDKGDRGDVGPPGERGLQGAKGDPGDAATISIGSVTTGQPGTSADVSNSGTSSAAVFDFAIPRGEPGIQGDRGLPGADGAAGADGAKGDPGDAATVSVGSVTTGEAGSSAAVNNSGSSSAAILDFTIPRGAQGAKGDAGDRGLPGADGAPGAKGDPGQDGAPGADGAAATISVGDVTTGAPGSSASVANSGSSHAAVLDFAIPRGDQGIQGPKGDTGNAGAAATVAVGSVATGAAGSNASVNNSGSSSAAVLDFSIPRGDTGAQGPAGPNSVTVNSTSTSGGAAGRFLYDDGSKVQETAGLAWDATNKRANVAAGYSFGWSNFRFESPDGNGLTLTANSLPLITADGQPSSALLQILNTALQALFGVTDRSDVVVNLMDGNKASLFMLLSNGVMQTVGNMIRPFREARSATTLTELDFTLYCPSGTFTITAPVLPWGMVFNIKNAGTGLITISGSIDGQTSVLLSPGDSLQIQSTGKGYVII